MVGERCDLRSLEIADKKSFLVFDQELRLALKQQDVAAIALLVRFPLRVNRSDGSTILLADVEALQRHFFDVFSSEVKSVILTQKAEEVFCKYTGIMYGGGEVWIDAVERGSTQRYGIKSVNLPGGEPQASSGNKFKLKFVCDAEQHRVVVDADMQGSLRYRAWNKPHRLADDPDVEVLSGTESVHGTGPCGHAMWTFSKDESEFAVLELGCTEASSTPVDAIGSLIVSVDGEPEHRSWCR